mmetsp:Transcript_44200/g.104032  ORF Transcript_44200/g.104032 Transcript_44200/m.104032 type:complete len:136 (+) Transcript_44200:111-518(+)
MPFGCFPSPMRFLKKDKNKQIELPESLVLGLSRTASAEQTCRKLADVVPHNTLDSVCDFERQSSQSTRKSSHSSSKASHATNSTDYSAAVETIVSLCGEAPPSGPSWEALRRNSESETNVVLDDKWEALLSALSH